MSLFAMRNAGAMENLPIIELCLLSVGGVGPKRRLRREMEMEMVRGGGWRMRLVSAMIFTRAEVGR